MKPSEFKNCTFKEIKKFVQFSFEKEKEEFLKNVNLLEIMSDKLLMNNPQIVKHPKNLKMREVFSKILDNKQEVETQNYEEIIKNMRAQM